MASSRCLRVLALHTVFCVPKAEDDSDDTRDIGRSVIAFDGFPSVCGLTR